MYKIKLFELYYNCLNCSKYFCYSCYKLYLQYILKIAISFLSVSNFEKSSSDEKAEQYGTSSYQNNIGKNSYNNINIDCNIKNRMDSNFDIETIELYINFISLQIQIYWFNINFFYENFAKIIRIMKIMIKIIQKIKIEFKTAE